MGRHKSTVLSTQRTNREHLMNIDLTIFNSTTFSSGRKICNSLLNFFYQNQGNTISERIKNNFPGEHAPGLPQQRAPPPFY